MMDENDAANNKHQPQTLVELLRIRANHLQDQRAFLYLVDGEEEGAAITYAELDRQARSIAAWLQQEGITGGRALLLYPSGLDFISAFFGCLYAGIVAVPVYPPRLNRPSLRIQSIVADAEISVALATNKIHRGLQRRFDIMPELAKLRWLNSEEMPGDMSAQWQDPGINGDDLAFLQYTSGSTGSPKGVMLTHGNLIHNLKIILHGFQMKESSTGAFWLPNYHDMGLIGGILAPLYVKGQSILMAPAAFLQRPARWLEAISKYKANVSGAPNFAYQMCVEKIAPEQREALDLSGWSVAFCGAEPIRVETLDDFAQTFAAQGFRRSAFYSCYGLAESTLLAAGGDGPTEPVATRFQASALSENRGVATPPEEKEAVTLVGCGHALLDQEIIIADPETLAACAPGEIGEIWCAGPSVAQGYWQQPQLTEEIFHAHLADTGVGANTEVRPYLRTGDLGFLHEGQLYVTGRLKDLIIIRGRNHYPQDIEHTAGKSHEALEAGMSAAFSVTVDGEEKLVLISEVTRRHRKPDLDSVVRAVRRAIAQEHQLQIYAILLIRPLSVPRTSSGKIQRHACKQGYLDDTLRVIAQWQAETSPAATASPERAEQYPSLSTPSEIAVWMVGNMASQLNISPYDIDHHAPFVDYGLDSVQAVTIAGEIENALGRSFSPTLLWDYPTIAALSAHLASTIDPALGALREAPHPEAVVRERSTEPIAVIGLSCRFPGANSVEAFWQLLQQGTDAISEVPADRWDLGSYYSAAEELQPGKMSTRWGGFLEQIDQFDAAFFGISPREAARLDPQQRLLLEVTWEALERSGQNPTALAGSATGVFVGISSSDYSRLQFSHPELIDAYAGTGNAHSIAANRLSYLLDLQGPSMAIDTACSSSLVATHLGMNSLRSGEIDLALIGGVNLLLAPDLSITFSQAQMMAADGRCKTFDARADGYVRGEGCGMVVLKRLSDAQRDGDPILALLRGSAVNQDGRSNGLTAPNGLAQQAVIRRALANAGVSPADIGYVEAHGTGTRLGDPIEVHALKAVFDAGETQNPLRTGSVKTNIGHLEAAAGVAGLIKTILTLAQGEIPPHLHFQELNPHISLEDSRLAVGGTGHNWPRDEQPRLAGVSSFGFGGTNAHVIVQEAPPAAADEPTAADTLPVHLFTLSAQDETALEQLANQYAALLAQQPSLALSDICYTANTGRAPFPQRLALTAKTTPELQQKLAGLSSLTVHPFTHSPINNYLAFLFTGQGAQYTNMGRDLYDTHPVFRATMDRCSAILSDIGAMRDPSLIEVIYPQGRGTSRSVPTGEAPLRNIDDTNYTQPALFAVEYALAELWRSWGVEPDAVMGHSVGEISAASVAGVLSLEDGLRLVAARGRLMGALPAGGTMAAIFAPAEQVQEVLQENAGQVTIAGYNGPRNIAISGPERAVTAVVEQLAAEGIEYRYLTVSHAFHSPLMEPMLDDFAAVAGQISTKAPRIPLVSNLTGELLSTAPDAGYWRRHAREAVRFTAGMQTLASIPAQAGAAPIFLEIGPQPHLTGMGRRCLAPVGTDSRVRPDPVWLYSLKKGRDDWSQILSCLGDLFSAGIDINWAGFYAPFPAGKIILPTYPFQRERHWLEGVVSNERPLRSRALLARDTGGQQVKRLPTPIPLFEALLDLSDPARNEEILRKTVLDVAAEFWGPGAHEIDNLAVGSPPRGRPAIFTTQTTLQVTGDSTAIFQLFTHFDENDSWHLLTSGQLTRGRDTVGRGASRSTPTLQSAPTSKLVTGQVLLDAPAWDQAELVQNYLQVQTAAVLGLESARLSRERPLDTLGMDSLMAMELKNGIERDLDIDLPLVNLLQGPTIVDLAGQLLEILAAAGTDAEARPDSRIEPLTIPGEAAPLTYDQQAMWLLHQLLPADTSVNVAGAARIMGNIDVPALRRALQELVERHAALRTTFTMEHGRPMQIVQPDAPDTMTEIDAANWDEAALHSFVQQEAHRPFDLAHGPLLRLVLLRRSEDESVLLLSLNHLITDFWSMALIVQELYQLYSSSGGVSRNASTAALPAINLLPADYAHWQTQMLSSPQGEALRSYWLDQLGGELPRLNLPTDRPRPAVLSFDGDSTGRLYDPALTARLKEFSREQGATLATTLLAAFQTLLHRYTGQEDLLVGSVIAGRERPELQRMAGYFVNPVALRADFSGQPSFINFLAQVKQTMLEAITHQEYPLPRLAEELAVAHQQHLDPSRPPLFETMFIMQRAQMMAGQEAAQSFAGSLSAFALGAPGARLDLGELAIEPLPLGGQPAQFDLTLMMAEVEDQLAATLHYNTQLFNQATAERMLHHLGSLLAGIAVGGGQERLAALPLLPAEEREKLLRTWNKTQAAYDKEKTLPQLVSEQAARTPHKVAVSFGAEELTYAELELRAGQLAAYLQALGVGPETLVALFVERSLEMMVGLLGILKAGGAYIPLDPDFPPERIRLMLDDARPALLVTQEHLLQDIKPISGQAVCLDTQWPAIEEAAPHRGGSRTAATNLAYVIYTSGSTGRPKGVQITHQAAVNFLQSMQREPGVEAGDHLLAVTTLSFDIALLEFFLPLISGAQVTIASRETATDGAALQQLIDKENITVMQATPATWHLLLESGWQGKENLKILCGGEALPAGLAKQLLPLCDSLWNMYGPTETTVWSTTCRISAETETITVGRPIANTQIYILDQELQPVPTGVAGDLYIAGDGLARGYLGRPELTAERFLPDPFTKPGSVQEPKMYKTGDLARYLPNGDLLFLGRNDFQVKIRGYRIELGDIEAALAQHPAIANNVCIAHELDPESHDGDRRLVSYMVPQGSETLPQTAELRAFLRARLPDYMVPAHFIPLEAMPLLPNGKINRRALPDPQLGAGLALAAGGEYTPPRSELEAQVAELSADVLSLEQISIHDSFFDLGGNSLLATRLIFEAREQFEVQIPLRQLYMQPTVAGLSAAIEVARENGQGPHDNGHGPDAQPLLGGMTLSKLQAEVKLDPEIKLDPAIHGEGLSLAAINDPRHVLLTGATGFVGAFLLRDLLQDSKATIHCLVRAADPQAGLERLRRNMAGYDLWQEAFAARVVALPGDLGRPLFGLPQEQFQELAGQIDVIMHNGALVNFIHDYQEHKAANVLGTQEVLRLAAQERLKAVHFVSTLSVFHTGAHDEGTVFGEDIDLDEIGVPFGGYAQSKWVGEKMILLAAERGVPTAIYRPGLVSGDSGSGVWNTVDMMSTMTRACIALGAVPELDVNVDIVPVDYVSKALVTLALGRGASQSTPTGKIYNLSNPQPMPYRDLLHLVNEAGLALRPVPFDQWRQMLVSMVQGLGGAGWNPFLPLLEEVTVDQVFMPAFDHSRTLQALSGSGVNCPPVGPELLQTYLRFFQASGVGVK